LARSPSILTRVVEQVGGDQNVTRLAGYITVELVPASGVVRISVQDQDPQRAAALASALSNELRALDLLGPVGNLRSFDAAAPVRKVAPDLTAGLGFGLAGGVIAGLLAGTLVALRRPRIVSRRQAAAVIGDSDIPVLSQVSLRDLDEIANPLLTREDVVLIGVNREATKLLHEIVGQRRDRAGNSSAATLGASGQDVALIGWFGRCSPEELWNAFGGARAVGCRVLAVVLLTRADTA